MWKVAESFHFYHVCISNFNWLMWWSFFDVSSLLFSFSCFARSASEGVCARGTERTIREHNFLIFLFARDSLVIQFGKGKRLEWSRVFTRKWGEKSTRERKRISTENSRLYEELRMCFVEIFMFFDSAFPFHFLPNMYKNTFLLRWFIVFIFIVSWGKLMLHHIWVSRITQIIFGTSKLSTASKCMHTVKYLPVKYFQSTQNVSRLINLSLETTPSSWKLFSVNLLWLKRKRIPKTVINNSLSKTQTSRRRKVHGMQETQTENFVQVNVSQKEFLCHSVLFSVVNLLSFTCDLRTDRFGTWTSSWHNFMLQRSHRASPHKYLNRNI